MNTAVLRRFIMIGIVVILAVPAIYIMAGYFDTPPGDYEVRQGDIHLSGGEFEEALEDFDRALQAQPDHRGALMGRAIVFLETGRHEEAEAAFRYLIDYLNRTLEEDDLTGWGVLAAAYANLGILYDRLGRYEDALRQYSLSLQVDEETVDGPDIFHRVLYNPRPATVRDRANYISEQLQLPEEERLLSVPEVDERQRMYKP